MIWRSAATHRKSNQVSSYPEPVSELRNFGVTTPISYFNFPSSRPLSIPSIFSSRNTVDMNRSPQLLTVIGFGVDGHITPSSAAATAPTAASIRKRRNGLTPACEPCRKAKVRCDTSPPGALCSRCRKRKTLDQCIFLEAPMTRQFRSVSHDPGTSLPSPKSPSQSSGPVGISPSSPLSTPISGRGWRQNSGLSFGVPGFDELFCDN